jgi:hypothetical protein
MGLGKHDACPMDSLLGLPPQHFATNEWISLGLISGESRLD